MQASAFVGQAPPVVAFRPAARTSSRQLRLAVRATSSTDRPSRPAGGYGGNGSAASTTPRPPPAPRPGGPRPYTPGGGNYTPGGGGGGQRSGSGGSYSPGGQGGARPYTPGGQGGARPYTPGGQGGSRPYTPGGQGGARPYTPRPGGGPTAGRSSDSDDDRRGGRFGGRGGRGRGPREPLVPMNENIRAPEVRVLAEDKSPMGVMDTASALAEARSLGLDMIMVVPDAQPPVVRLMEFSKYNYELEKANKEAKKKQRDSVIETKELKLRPATDVHDYQVKVKAAQKFLGKGHRVKLTLQFRGREMEFQQIGREMFQRFVEDCGPDIAVEQAPQMQGRQMGMVLAPKKEQLQV